MIKQGLKPQNNYADLAERIEMAALYALVILMLGTSLNTDSYVIHFIWAIFGMAVIARGFSYLTKKDVIITTILGSLIVVIKVLEILSMGP